MGPRADYHQGYRSGDRSDFIAENNLMPGDVQARNAMRRYEYESGRRRSIEDQAMIDNDSQHQGT